MPTKNTKSKNPSSAYFDQRIAQIQQSAENAKKLLAEQGIRRVRLSKTRAKFIADNWDDKELWEDVSIEVGYIRQELETKWESWKSNHPIRALFKSQRQKALANLKRCANLFATKEFYEAFARGEYGTQFADYQYYGQVGGKWPE